MSQADIPLARVHALLDQRQSEQAVDGATPPVARAAPSVHASGRRPKPGYFLPL